jgi:hypothetical protein
VPADGPKTVPWCAWPVGDLNTADGTLDPARGPDPQRPGAAWPSHGT